MASASILSCVVLALCCISSVFGQACPTTPMIQSWADQFQPTQTVTVGSGGTYATLTDARNAGAVTPGTQVILQGTFSALGFHQGIRGTANAPIWIGGASAQAMAVITGSSGGGFQCTQCAYVVFQYMECSGYDGNGFNIDDGGDYANFTAAHHLVFRGLDIHDIGTGGNSDCLKLSGINDYVIYDNTMADCSGQAIDHVGCHNGIIGFNSIRTSGVGVQTKGGSYDIVIAWNRFEDFADTKRAINAGGSTGFEFFRPPLSTSSPNAEGQRIYVLANVFVSNAEDVVFAGCVNCIAAHNTHVNTVRRPFRVLQETVTTAPYTFLECGDNVVVNEIVTYSTATINQRINVGGNTRPTTIQWINVLWYATDNPSASAPPTNEYAGGTVTGAITGQDPGFTNTYQISGSSPAAGAGVTANSQNPALALPPSDYDRRCYSTTAPSIGAYEVTPAASCDCSLIYSIFGAISDGNLPTAGSVTTGGNNNDDNGSPAPRLAPFSLLLL